MAEIDPETLLPNDRVKDAVKSGEMTQITRGKAYADEGDTFSIDGETFEVDELVERTLGSFTDEDASAEGSPSLAAYKERMMKAHGGHFTWDDDADVVSHRFVRR